MSREGIELRHECREEGFQRRTSLITGRGLILLCQGGEAVSTQCGGDGLTVFYGMAKPVRAPQIGPARSY